MFLFVSFRYRIYIVEQSASKLFNKAKLNNAGFVEALKDQVPTQDLAKSGIYSTIKQNVPWGEVWVQCTQIPPHGGRSVTLGQSGYNAVELPQG